MDVSTGGHAAREGWRACLQNEVRGHATKIVDTTRTAVDLSAGGRGAGQGLARWWKDMTKCWAVRGICPLSRLRDQSVVTCVVVYARWAWLGYES